jgi:uncharacterized protein YhaN
VEIHEAELERIGRQLKTVEREQHQLLQWALKDFPSDQVEAENKRLNKAKVTLNAQMAGIQAQISASRNAIANVPHLKKFIRTVQDNLSNLFVPKCRTTLSPSLFSILATVLAVRYGMSRFKGSTIEL